MQLRGRFPSKHAGEIADLHAERTNGYLAEDEWSDIVNYMYTEADNKLLVSLLKETVARRSYTPLEISQRKARLSREGILARREHERSVKGRVAYKDFVKVLLDFHLKNYEESLAPYLRLFNCVDTDANGIISEFEFRRLAASMELGFSEEEVLRLLQLVDPFNNQQITFSESVSLFTSVGPT
jgi:hypothetical protein